MVAIWARESLRERTRVEFGWDPRTGNLLVSGSWGTGITGLRLVSPEDGVAHDLDPRVTIGFKNAAPLYDVSKDGRLLIYAKEDVSGDIWVLEASNGLF